MADDKFLLVNLEDEKSKSLANVISSDSARKILNILSEKPLSESDISKRLKIPLPTVDYNIKQLLDSKLVEVHDFLWSDKGKKVNYYKLSNKLIIISPGKTPIGFFDKLKDLIPVVVFGGLASIGIYVYQNYFLNLQKEVPMLKSATLMQASEVASTSFETTTSNFNYALWFFIGFISFLVLYLIYYKFKKK